MSYDWLYNEGAPRLLVQAIKHIGVKEIEGKKHNPIILNWAREINLDKVYNSDEIPWCGLYIAYICKMAGLDVVSKPLWALSWSTWGNEAKEPMLGDILTFKRDGGGHVGLYIGEDRTHYHVLGGNQNNQVNVMRIAKSRLHQARRTAWKIAQPSNVRKIELSNKGIISTNEA
jgi:uncharacterized protein (TIGR02594 family)